MLDVTNLSVNYDAVTAVVDISFSIADGECVAFLGPNGAGKSSTLKAISGLVRHGGTVELDGVDVSTTAPDRIAKQGLIHVPEGRRLFSELTVHENLQVAVTARAKRNAIYSIDDVYDIFPALTALRSTRAWSLSGGEQQMVAIGRALVAAPKLLMLDEPSLGLSPKNVGVVSDALRRIKGTTSVLLVEQNTHVALDIASRAYVLSAGSIVMQGPTSEMLDRGSLLDAYLGQNVPVE
jgi:branched-chain amino acid transport system ATP-binding protein